MEVTMADFSSLVDALEYFARKMLAMTFRRRLPTDSVQARPRPQTTEYPDGTKSSGNGRHTGPFLALVLKQLKVNGTLAMDLLSESTG